MANSTSVTKCTDFSVISLCRDMKTSPPDPAIVVGGTGTNMKLTLPLAACAPFSSNINGPTGESQIIILIFYSNSKFSIVYIMLVKIKSNQNKLQRQLKD